MEVRAFTKQDYKQWLPLWNANGLNQVSQNVTNSTWQRLCDPDSPVNGFGAFISLPLTPPPAGGKRGHAEQGESEILAGFVHYILHPITGHIEPACYMQDLFTHDDFRRKGVARALVNRLHLEGQAQKWARIYWLAEKDNNAAQNLYKTLGIRLDFTLHILPTE